VAVCLIKEAAPYFLKEGFLKVAVSSFDVDDLKQFGVRDGQEEVFVGDGYI